MKIFKAEPINLMHFHDLRIGFIDRLFIKGLREKQDFNRSMFDEDFARLFHYGNHRSDNLFQISSNDEALTKRLLGSVKTRYAPHPLDETLLRLTEEISQTLIRIGEAYYLIRDDSEDAGIHIIPFASTGIVSFFNRHIQWVPKRTERHWKRNQRELPREIRILDAAKVMSFEMPRKIKRMLSIQNRTLATLDKHQFGLAAFHPVATHENPNPTNHFDFSIWRDTQENALYLATRGTGWNGRKYDSSKRSDFFDCHRLIRFRRNQLMLRDNILKQLSAGLSRVGRGYNANYTVEISGTEKLPSVKYLDKLEGRLSREEASFSEVIDYCLKR